MPASDHDKQIERGRDVALLLAGAWRSPSPSFSLDPKRITEIVPSVVATGAGGLGWWKVRGLDPAEIPALSILEEAFEHQRVDGFFCDVALGEVIDELRFMGIEPLTSKGWAVGRLYPATGLRPSRDVTLHVDPSRFEEAERCLKTRSDIADWISVQSGAAELPDRTMADLFRRARRHRLGDVVVRPLGDEDHLRLLCLHFVEEGGWRPWRLCDLGVFLDSLPGDFDWGYCLSGDANRTRWVQAVLGLAGRLIGARIEGVPDLGGFASPANGLDRAILAEWGKADTGEGPRPDLTSAGERFAFGEV